MVQGSGAHQLRSPLQGKPGSRSEADSSMWALVLVGILSAIFAWVWYGRRENKKDPGAQVQQEEDAAVGSEPDTLQSEQRPLTSAVTSGSGTPLAPAPVHSDERCHNVPAEDQAQHASVPAGGGMRAKETPGHTLLSQEDDKLELENVSQQDKAQIIGGTPLPDREGAPIIGEKIDREAAPIIGEKIDREAAPIIGEKIDREAAPIIGEKIDREAAPINAVPNKCAAESNVDCKPADAHDKKQSDVTHAHSVQVQEKATLQSIPDNKHPKDLQEKSDLQVGEDDVLLAEECIQVNGEGVHALQLHEEDGEVPPEHVPGQEEDTPTHIQSTDKGPGHASGVQQHQMTHLSAQRIGVLHMNGEEESHANAIEAPGLKEFSVALPENSITLPGSTKERKECQKLESKVMVNDINILYKNDDGCPDQESLEQLKTDLAVDLSSTNHNDIAAFTTGVQVPIPSNNVSSKTTYEEVTIANILDNELRDGHAKPVFDKCTKVFPSSNQVESSTPERSVLGEKSYCDHSEAMVDYPKTKKVAAVQPMSQNVNVGFKVHYMTCSDSQCIAVTGDHEKLGKWEAYVPLAYVKDGFWSHLVTLPADTNIEWKFVMVENGKIKRWEDCSNRCLKTALDDIETQQWWGYP